MSDEPREERFLALELLGGVFRALAVVVAIAAAVGAIITTDEQLALRIGAALGGVVAGVVLFAVSNFITLGLAIERHLRVMAESD